MKNIPALALFLSMLIAVSCGSSRSNPALPDSGGSQPETAEIFTNGRFALTVLPGSYIAGGAVDAFSIDVVESADATVLNVVAQNAVGLKAVYLDLQYPADELQPVSATVAGEFAGEDNVLDLSILSEPGIVHHGQIKAHPDDIEGYNGSGTVVSFEFSNSAFVPAEAHAPLSSGRQISSPPNGNGSRADIGHVSGTTYGLFWHYYNLGDYNQDSEVNISDLTPLALNYHKVGPFNPAGIDGVVDGDTNSEINISDITPIAVNFGGTVTGFNLYASHELADYPVDGGPSTITPYLTKEYDDYQTPDSEYHLGPLPKDGRLFYWGDLPVDFMFQNYAYYWVRPTDGEEEGVPSYCLAGVLDGAGGANLPEIRIDDIQLPNFNQTTPFIAVPGGQYQLEIIHPQDGDITTSEDTEYRIVNRFGFPIPGASVDKSTGILSFADDVPTDEVIAMQYFYKYRNYGQGLFGVPYPPIPSQSTHGGQGQDDPNGTRFKLNGEIQAPIASLVTSSYEGPVPLTVMLDASASTDPDDGAESLEFFWDPGVLSENPLKGTSIEFTYTEPGIYTATVSVRDPWYSWDSASVVLKALPAAGQPPKAVLHADNNYFSVPLEVNFNASASLVSSGRTIVKYEWDLDGNGTFEEDTGDVPFTSQLYAVSQGTLQTKVRVTDSEGDMDEATWPITALPAQNDLPVIELAISATSGSSPLVVDFDASGTFDPDGTIANIFWDFDYDGESDGEPGTTRQFTYITGGSFRGRVIAIDDEGGASLKDFTIRVDDPPVAVLNDDPSLFFPPATIEFDASGSSDPNGSIVEYHWDFDGDGVDDQTTTEPLASHEYLAGPGVWVRLTVVDDDGLSDYTESYRSFL